MVPDTEKSASLSATTEALIDSMDEYMKNNPDVYDLSYKLKPEIQNASKKEEVFTILDSMDTYLKNNPHLYHQKHATMSQMVYLTQEILDGNSHAKLLAKQMLSNENTAKGLGTLSFKEDLLLATKRHKNENPDLKPDPTNKRDSTEKDKGTQDNQGVEGRKGPPKAHAPHNIPKNSGITDPDQSNPKLLCKSKQKSTRLVNKVERLQRHVDRMESHIQNLRKENQEQREQLKANQNKIDKIEAKVELLSITTNKNLADVNFGMKLIQSQSQKLHIKLDNLSKRK